MRLIISLSALLLSVILVQIGTGSLGPLDALSGITLGFSSTQIGFLGSAHFIGFFIGCVMSPYIVVRAGHARAFAVMAGLSTISILLHPVYESVWSWCLLRIMSGFAVAGAYTVIESWLQSRLTNENRGTVFSIYRMVDMSGTLLSQIVIAGLTPAYYVSYNLLAVISCLALIPIALSQATPPALPKTQKFRPFFAYVISPLAAIGIVVAGLSTASFRMMAPVFGQQSGLTQNGIAAFLALVIIGGLIAQLPAGVIADRLNRRVTLIGFSLLSALACALISFNPVPQLAGIPFIYIGGFLFGFATLPIYSICASHANDFAKSEDMLSLSASLIFFFALGAVTAPTIAGYLVQEYGPAAMFNLILLAHLLLLLYSGWRSFRRPVAEALRPYSYMPRTTLYIMNVVRGRRSRGSRGK